MPSLISLFLKILKLGATAYGGPAMINQIKESAVNRYGWVTPNNTYLAGESMSATVCSDSASNSNPASIIS